MDRGGCAESPPQLKLATLKRWMGRKTAESLQALEALPAEERQAFAVEILRRTREVPFDR
jgi:hypothetical protein